MDNDVPFIANTPDDTHCLPASFAMIRGFFEPDLTIGWDEWSETVGYVPGKGSWSMAGLMWFKDHGYEVVHIAAFDYKEFAARGPEYLLEALDEETAMWDIKFTDFDIEQARAARFMRSGIWLQRQPTVDDIRNYLTNGYLIKCSVNLHALNGRTGYLSHAVVLKGMTEHEVIMHDPGLPARPSRHVPIEDFLLAWDEPNRPGSAKMDAVRKLKVSPQPSRSSADGAATAEIGEPLPA
jgi:hypothetical protein